MRRGTSIAIVVLLLAILLANAIALVRIFR